MPEQDFKGTNSNNINVNNPAFLAYLSSTAADVTGDGTVYTPLFDTERFDQNSNYNTGTGNFTAPVTGKYRLTAQVTLAQLAAAHNDHLLFIVTSNKTYSQEDTFAAGANPFVGNRTIRMTVLADMDAADTVHINLAIGGGTKVVDVYGEASGGYTFFCGELVC